MSKEKELIVAIGKLLEKEMRALEGDAILSEMQLDGMKKDSLEFNLDDFKDGFSFAKYMMDILDARMSFMKSFGEQEGKYYAYSKVSDLIQKFLKND
jgi:hypothetical protein